MLIVKVLFFGTGSVAAPALEQLHQSRHTIVQCVTTPDRAQGRGLGIRPAPIKRAASALGVPVLQPPRLDDVLARRLEALRPEIGVVVDYGLKVPTPILHVPQRGTIGVHPSLLPKYRGASPIQWAILRGEELTGVTVFRVTEAMDSGEVLLQDMTAIAPEETAVELRDRLAQQGAALLVRALDLLERGEVQWHPQDDRAATPAPKLTKADGCIDWAQPAPAIVNRIRGVQPWPVAFTAWQGKTLRLWRGRSVIGCAVATPGTVVNVTSAGCVVSAGAGGVELTEVQLEGGRRMPAAAFCRGHALREGGRLGA